MFSQLARLITRRRQFSGGAAIDREAFAFIHISKRLLNRAHGKLGFGALSGAFGMKCNWSLALL